MYCALAKFGDDLLAVVSVLSWNLSLSLSLTLNHVNLIIQREQGMMTLQCCEIH